MDRRVCELRREVSVSRDRLFLVFYYRSSMDHHVCELRREVSVSRDSLFLVFLLPVIDGLLVIDGPLGL